MSLFTRSIILLTAQVAAGFFKKSLGWAFREIYWSTSCSIESFFPLTSKFDIWENYWGRFFCNFTCFRRSIMQCMCSILTPKMTAPKTKSGFERLLIYISKYMLIIMHIILKWQSTSKTFKNKWKLITLVWGWVNYYKQVTEKLIYSDKNKPKQTTLAST